MPRGVLRGEEPGELGGRQLWACGQSSPEWRPSLPSEAWRAWNWGGPLPSRYLGALSGASPDFLFHSLFVSLSLGLLGIQDPMLGHLFTSLGEI